MSVLDKYLELGDIIKRCADIEINDEFKANIEQQFIDSSDTLHLAHQLDDLMEVEAWKN